jgi:PAS domain S-box-containing protein
MILDQEKITRIKKLLKTRPKGLTISDISQSLKINRNSVAKYLEILLITGQVEMRMYGNAKVYYLSNRVPISSMLKFANELILVLDGDLRVMEANDNFLSYFSVKRDDLIGHPISDTPVNIIGNIQLDELARSAIDSGELSRELSAIRGNTTNHIQVKVVPSVFDDGTKGTTLLFEDITEKKEVEERLKFSESKYRGIVEDQTEMVNRYDKDFQILYANKAVALHLGGTPEEFIGKNILDYLPAADRDQIRARIKSITPENPVITIEHRVINAEGQTRWHQWTNRGIFDDRGNITVYQGVGRDITDKKEAEQALLVKDLALESSLSGIQIVDLSGKVTYANAALLRMFGWDHEDQILGKQVKNIVTEIKISDPPFQEIWNAVLEEGSWSGEIVCWRRDGTQFIALLNASRVQDPSGAPLCMMASFFDITELKKTREELQLKDTAIASATNSIAIFNREYRLIYANDSFLNDFELTLEKIRGKLPRDLFTNFDSVNPAYEEIEAEMRSGGKWNGELRITTRDGQRLYFMASFNQTIDSEGNLLYTLASFVNISESKSIETALKSTKQKLSETIEFMPDPTFIVNKDHVVIAWNRAIELLTGIRKDEVIGKKDYQKAFSFFQKERPVLVDILDLPPHELARKYPNVRKYSDSIYVETFVPSMHDGKGAYLWGKASLLVDHEDHIIGAIESIRDISAWKQARESLRKLDTRGTSSETPALAEQKMIEELTRVRQELESVLDLMDEAVLLADKSGTILWVNERFIQLVEGDRRIVLGAPLSTFFPADDQKILSGPAEERTLRITLIPLTGSHIIPVEVKTATLPAGDERVVIFEQTLS